MDMVRRNDKLVEFIAIAIEVSHRTLDDGLDRRNPEEASPLTLVEPSMQPAWEALPELKVVPGGSWRRVLT